MEEILMIIGAAVLSIILVAFPILCGLSFGLDWHDSIKLLLITGSSGTWAFITFMIAFKE